MAGLGIVWLPDCIAQRYAKGETLVRSFPDWQLDPMPMRVAFHSSRRSNAKLRAFVKWMAECISIN